MITVSTYNIHRCIGIDRRRDPDRIIRVIEEMNADIVGLQEVDRFHAAHDTYMNLQDLAEGSGYRVVMGPTMQKDYGHYGNALLSRLEIANYNTIDLSVRGREPRGAIDVTLSSDNRDMRIIATHLGLSIRERKQQVKTLLGTVCSESPSGMVVMGDINEWSPFASCLRDAGRHFIGRFGIRTYPSVLPVFALDRIWLTPDIKISSMTAHRSETARIASDHLPLKAVIDYI